MNIFNLTTYKIIFLATLAVITFNLQADMNGKDPKAKDHAMEQKMANSLMIMNGWVRLTPPISNTTAAYFILHNTSKKGVTVVGVSTDIAEISMMHDVVIEKSMARMVHLNELTIPAGQMIAFTPGGKHLMLVNLTEKLEASKKVSVTFTLENGEKITSIMKVKSEKNKQSSGHKH